MIGDHRALGRKVKGMAGSDDPAPELIARFSRDRWLAHKILFAHRHPVQSAPMHQEMVALIHSPLPHQVIEGFRGCAKSTYLEEAAVLRACFRQFNNMVILGASYSRACDRLLPIKRELEANEALVRVFGVQRGSIWQEGKIVLTSGICIQALGRDQSLLGIKHGDWRPDALFIDDVEDPQEVRTDSEREKTWGWVVESLLPALDDPLSSWVRVLGTRRGRGSLPERLETRRWPVRKFPIEYRDPETGERQASWEGKFPLSAIDAMRRNYSGDMHAWTQEYMCEPISAAHRVFDREMFRVRPDEERKPWEAAYAMYDPARTADRRNATTGKAVWSYRRNGIVFWELRGERWLPDRIIDDIFATDETFSPVWIGFEKTGLAEWAMQIIRQEMLKRRTMVPLRGIEAPRGLGTFIESLQPFAKNGEIVLAGDPERFQGAIDQFASYPYGPRDAPTAAAYALVLRPGAPVYEAFADEHVADGLMPIPGTPLYIAGNSDGAIVTAALVQYARGEMRVIADWVREGTPADVAADIHAEAALAAAGRRLPLTWIVPARHRETYRNVGLVAAVRRIPQGITAAPESMAPDRGRVRIAELLESRRFAEPRFQVGTAALWTLRALAGGYARAADPRGLALPDAQSTIYKVLMEGIEAFAAVCAGLEKRDEDGENARQPVAYDRRGIAYASAMPAPRERR
jgi:hypothetical protein